MEEDLSLHPLLSYKRITTIYKKTEKKEDKLERIT